MQIPCYRTFSRGRIGEGPGHNTWNEQVRGAKRNPRDQDTSDFWWWWNMRYNHHPFTLTSMFFLRVHCLPKYLRHHAWTHGLLLGLGMVPFSIVSSPVDKAFNWQYPKENVGFVCLRLFPVFVDGESSLQIGVMQPRALGREPRHGLCLCPGCEQECPHPARDAYPIDFPFFDELHFVRCNKASETTWSTFWESWK